VQIAPAAQLVVGSAQLRVGQGAAGQLKQIQLAGRLISQARWVVGEQHAQLAIAPRDRARVDIGLDAEQPVEVEPARDRLGDLRRAQVEPAEEAARQCPTGRADAFIVERCATGRASMHSFEF
jgi:hypothetical protein